MSFEARAALASSLCCSDGMTVCGGIGPEEIVLNLRLRVPWSDGCIFLRNNGPLIRHRPNYWPDIQEAHPQLIPKLVDWAHRYSKSILEMGEPLDSAMTQVARQVGVKAPERIRVWVVRDLPTPEDLELTNLAFKFGLLGAGTVSLSFGYCVVIRRVFINDLSFFSHEFRHVQQFENSNSLTDYLTEYFKQIAIHGYSEAPLEVDAWEHEIDIPATDKRYLGFFHLLEQYFYQRSVGENP